MNDLAVEDLMQDAEPVIVTVADEDQVEGEQAEAEEAEELVVTIGEDAPPPEQEEDRTAPEWVRNLRKENRELKRVKRELEAKLVAPAVEQTLGPKPTLEGSDYDADKFEAALLKWNADKRKHDEEAAAKRAEEEAQDKAWQARLSGYQTAKTSLKVKDFDDAEDTVKEALSIPQQAIILQGAKDPALLVYALGKSPAKVKELSEIKDPVQFAFAVARMEATVKATTRKPTTSPETTLSGNGRPSGAVDDRMAKLKSQAEASGDWTEYFAAKRKAAK